MAGILTRPCGPRHVSWLGGICRIPRRQAGVGDQSPDAAGQYLSAVWEQSRANACPAPLWCQNPDNAPVGLRGRGWTYKGYFVNDSFVVENSAVLDGFKYP